jgi:hypothetical protein
MDIIEFFQQSVGKWTSQRSNHLLSAAQPESDRSEIYMDFLPQDDPAVVELCQSHQVDPALALCGLRIKWDGTTQQGRKKHTGTALLVAIQGENNGHAGRLLRTSSSPDAVEAPSRYVMGNDDALTFITENDALYAEERVWFASPNLRLRTNVLRDAEGVSTASFCSEIRMVSTPPQS